MVVVNQAWQTFHWGLNGHISATSLASPPSFSRFLSVPRSLFLPGLWPMSNKHPRLFRLLDTLCSLLGGRPPGKLILIQNQFSLLSLFSPTLLIPPLKPSYHHEFCLIQWPPQNIPGFTLLGRGWIWADYMLPVLFGGTCDWKWKGGPTTTVKHSHRWYENWFSLSSPFVFTFGIMDSPSLPSTGNFYIVEHILVVQPAMAWLRYSPLAGWGVGEGVRGMTESGWRM